MYNTIRLGGRPLGVGAVLRDSIGSTERKSEHSSERIQKSAYSSERNSENHKRNSENHKRNSENHKRNSENHKRNLDLMPEIMWHRKFDTFNTFALYQGAI